MKQIFNIKIYVDKSKNKILLQGKEDNKLEL